MNIKPIIERIRDEYCVSAYDINDGLCEEFMKDVLNEVPDAEECSTGLVFDNPYMSYPIHVWVYYDGKHYDAECPGGVENFLELPFFQRTQVPETYDNDDLRDNRYTAHV